MMKTIKAVAAFAALLTASATRAESVDATASLEYLFAPAEARWGTGTDDATLLARAVHCLKYIDGLLNAGITGRGVKVGVVDTGIGDIVTGAHTNLKCAAVHGVPSGAPHGTGVEGIIASDTFGIAPECSLYAYEGTGFVDDINGLWWCLTNGCKVVNFSGGYTPFDYTESQLEWARKQIRTMIDDSAGLNDNWAKDFCAFGQNVPVFTSRTGATGVNGGSSFAAPMVTGIIALYLQQNPELTRDEIYGILKDACRKLAEGRSKVYGFGLVQAATLPANYKTQAQIDAEKAAYVKTTKLELRTTDRNLYWYCGNMPTFNPVGLDQVLTIPATTATGRFLVYECRNAEREVIGRLRVDVVAKGQESAPDHVGFCVSIASRCLWAAEQDAPPPWISCEAQGGAPSRCAKIMVNYYSKEIKQHYRVDDV